MPIVRFSPCKSVFVKLWQLTYFTIDSLIALELNKDNIETHVIIGNIKRIYFGE